LKFEEYLKYQPRTGNLIWIKPTTKASRVKKGDVAGFLMQSGYRYVCIFGVYYLAHRVCWYLKTGKWPEHDIDHEDTNKDNNKWKNIRNATDSQNQANRKIQKNNTSGYKGVSWHKRHGKYVASIEVRGKAIWLGCHASKELAGAAYAAAAKKHFGEFARVK
jgi:hypothetical protein